MNKMTLREILIFVIGKTPQIVTETLYGLILNNHPPVLPDEIHIITTSEGKRIIEKELFDRGRLAAFFKEFNLNSLPAEKVFIHIIKNEAGYPIDDIRKVSDNEAVGDFVSAFIKEKAEDMNTRLHCSIAGGRKTMSFYLGSALQLFGRSWDKLYHVLVSPEFESHSDFYYKPKRDKILKIKDLRGKVLKKIHTKDASISLVELPFIRLRNKIPMNGKGFKELVQEGQREIDVAVIHPSLKVDLSEKVVYIGQVGIDMVPMQMILYVYFLRRKLKGCHRPEESYCYDCTDCFSYLGELSKRKALDEMAEDYRKAYGPSSVRVEEFLRKWDKRGGIDSDILRQNISKINTTLKEHLKDETLLPYFIITPVGKYGSKRYGVRVEKGKIVIE